MRPKVGHIQFLNCLPLYYGLVKSSALLEVDLIRGTPTELNRLLIDGELVISPISSIEYARHHESLLLMPDFTVSSDGEVKSILLISRFPIEKLSGKRIALTTTSATSQVLLKYVLSKGYKVEPEYFQSQPELDKMLVNADAALLIGDVALKHYINGKDMFLYDLGIEWKKLTGMKMVYAVWAVNKEFAETKSDLCEYVYEIFRKSMDYSMEHLAEIADYASRWEPFSPSFLMDYFRSLHFNFGKDYQEGLLRFYQMAAAIGELESVPELEFIHISSGKSVQ